MSKSKNAFTLIEMLVVIFIITIILMITMNFSGDRIQLLNNKNTQEEFITAFNDPYLLVSNSNYIDGKKYNSLDIILSWGDNKISYTYHLSDWTEKTGSNNVYDKIKINSLDVNWNKSNSLKISFTPYQLWCIFNNNEKGVAHMKIAVNNEREEYCFKISSQLGRLITIDCKETEMGWNWNGWWSTTFYAIPAE